MILVVAGSLAASEQQANALTIKNQASQIEDLQLMIMAKSGSKSFDDSNNNPDDNVLLQTGIEEKHRSAHRATMELKQKSDDLDVMAVDDLMRKYDEKEKLFSMPSEVEFDINEFERLVQKSHPMIEMLSVKSEYGLFIPSDLKIIRTESLCEDLRRHLKIDLKHSRNVSPYKELADKVKQSAEVKSIIMNSRHKADIDFFYG